MTSPFDEVKMTLPPLSEPSLKPTEKEAEEAFRLLLRWAGEDPAREGLKETPARAVRAWKEFFKGYKEDPKKHLETTFQEVSDFEGTVNLEKIRVESYCEHHLVPIIGEAIVAYIPNRRVVGISKLARMIDGYARRLQIQEKLTSQVAHAIDEVLQPKGVAVAIRATHLCISTRGIHKPESRMLTTTTLGCFETDPARRAEFMMRINSVL